jgi:hypothetical protein
VKAPDRYVFQSVCGIGLATVLKSMKPFEFEFPLVKENVCDALA